MPQHRQAAQAPCTGSRTHTRMLHSQQAALFACAPSPRELTCPAYGPVVIVRIGGAWPGAALPLPCLRVWSDGAAASGHGAEVDRVAPAHLACRAHHATPRGHTGASPAVLGQGGLQDDHMGQPPAASLAGARAPGCPVQTELGTTSKEGGGVQRSCTPKYMGSHPAFVCHRTEYRRPKGPRT